MAKNSKLDFKNIPNRNSGIIKEFLFFLKENKKWWLVPILLAFLLMGALLLAGGTGAAPFIYTLF